MDKNFGWTAQRCVWIEGGVKALREHVLELSSEGITVEATAVHSPAEPLGHGCPPVPRPERRSEESGHMGLGNANASSLSSAPSTGVCGPKDSSESSLEPPIKPKPVSLGADEQSKGNNPRVWRRSASGVGIPIRQLQWVPKSTTNISEGKDGDAPRGRGRGRVGDSSELPQ